MSVRDVILIIGVGRSGTSALTRALSLSGCTLPEEIMGASDINLKGSWEPADIWKLNHRFMLRHDTEYADPTMRLQETVFAEGEKEGYIRSVQEFLTRCPPGPALLIKQPDITEVMEFWLEAAKREHFSVKVVIPIRNPREVLASIGVVGSTMGETVSAELVNAFWLKRNLLAERYSRGLPRVFLEYPNFLNDWESELARISRSLSIDLKPDETAIADFLTQDLYRQRCSGPIIETFAYSWITRVYAILSSAAQDGPIDTPTLDEIYFAYRANERAFRIAWDEFRNQLRRVDKQQFLEGLETVDVMKSGRDF